MAILVCGGAGYIGSHTVARLLEKNYETVVIDNLETGHREAVPPQAKFYQGDLKDGVTLSKIFGENQITAVIDFAAYSLVGESVREPLKYFENNTVGTLCLLKAMLDARVKHIVFSSTAAVYGEPERVPILERDMTNPTNPYGESKLAVEKILKWFDAAYGLKYVALRYFNVAGAHPGGEMGEDHNPETHLIPNVLKAALGQTKAISIFGEDYDTPDGTCIRDYIHVTDLADAHILAVEKLAKENVGAVYNLGNGKGFSVKEIVDTAKKVTGVDFPVEICPRRPGDPSTLVASSEKIIRELGWQPQYNSLERIIETAWCWHSGHPDGYNKDVRK